MRVLVYRNGNVWRSMYVDDADAKRLNKELFGREAYDLSPLDAHSFIQEKAKEQAQTTAILTGAGTS